MSTTPAANEDHVQIARTARALDSLRTRHAALRLRAAARLLRREFAAAHAISVQVSRCHTGPACTGKVELIAVHDTARTIWHVDRDLPRPGHEHSSARVMKLASDVEHELGAALDYGAAPVLGHWHQIEPGLYDIDLPDTAPSAVRAGTRPAQDSSGRVDGAC